MSVCAVCLGVGSSLTFVTLKSLAFCLLYSCYKHLPQSPWVQWEERANRSSITRDLKPQTRNASESGRHEVQYARFYYLLYMFIAITAETRLRHGLHDISLTIWTHKTIAKMCGLHVTFYNVCYKGFYKKASWIIQAYQQLKRRWIPYLLFFVLSSLNVKPPFFPPSEYHFLFFLFILIIYHFVSMSPTLPLSLTININLQLALFSCTSVCVNSSPDCFAKR